MHPIFRLWCRAHRTIHPLLRFCCFLFAPATIFIGPGNASYTLVEYGDYEYPDCGRLYPILRHLQKDFAALLRVLLLQARSMSTFPMTARAEKPGPKSWYDSVSTLGSVA